MRWSELSPAQLAIELAKLGTNVDQLVLDARDVPELEPALRGKTKEEKREIAVEWFGDRGNPQPATRSDWSLSGYTPEWDGCRGSWVTPKLSRSARCPSCRRA